MATPHLKTWTDLQRFMFPQNKWLDAIEEAKGVMRLLGLPNQAKVLDLPCGVGRHSIQLAKFGMRVTGVDITREFLMEAQTRASDAKVSAEWTEGDMRSFTRKGHYDAIVNLYTSFGYFRDPKDDETVLENFFSSLRPGGKLLMDLMSREIFQKSMPPSTETLQPDGSVIRSEHRFTENGRWLENKWTYSAANQPTAEAAVGLRLYSKEELCALLTKTGFIDIKTFGDFDGSPYSSESVHLLVLARRPGLGIA